MSVHGKKNEVERKPSLENGAIRVEKQPSGINIGEFKVVPEREPETQVSGTCNTMEKMS